MEVIPSRSFEVSELTQASEARRGAQTMAREIGFDDTIVGKVGIVVTEAATNMVKHAKGGKLVVQPLGQDGWRGIGALALDRGAGMNDLSERMRDGFSTTGTSGTGLGAIRRQSSVFDVYSVPQAGTAVFSGIWLEDQPVLMGGLLVGGISIPVAGETDCGDAWALEAREDRLHVMVIDGLGHGPVARDAASAATRAFRENAGRPIEEAMARLHDALRSTRGAAGALVEIVPSKQIVRYCGVGNIVGRLFDDDKERSLVSHFGTLGHDTRKIREFQYPWMLGASLVLHSDGLTDRWSLSDYPGLAQRDPTLIAGVLYRDHARGRDDCTVVVVKSPA